MGKLKIYHFPHDFMGPKEETLDIEASSEEQLEEVIPAERIVEIEKIIEKIVHVPFETIVHVEKEVVKYVDVEVEKIIEIEKHIVKEVKVEVEKLIEKFKCPKWAFVVMAVEAIIILILKGIQ